MAVTAYEITLNPISFKRFARRLGGRNGHMTPAHHPNFVDVHPTTLPREAAMRTAFQLTPGARP